MTKEEMNKVIADFMGFTRGEDKYYGGMLDEQGNSTYPCWVKPDGVKTSHVYYHTSWDWLMPCFKKFNDMVQSGEIKHDYESSSIHDCLEIVILRVDIEDAHKYFYQLVQWYNSQK